MILWIVDGEISRVPAVPSIVGLCGLRTIVQFKGRFIPYHDTINC